MIPLRLSLIDHCKIIYVKLLYTNIFYFKQVSNYLFLSTRLASSRKSFKLVPISDRQKTATSMLFVSNGVEAMLQAIMSGRLATKSNEYVLFGIDLAKRPSPHPKSATT